MRPSCPSVDISQPCTLRSALQRRVENVLFGMAKSYPTIIPGLRSPSEPINGLVYFGRMLDKIRLAAKGKLPADWEENRGTKAKNSFDSRFCNFLKIDYAALEAETLKGGTDEE